MSTADKQQNTKMQINKLKKFTQNRVFGSYTPPSVCNYLTTQKMTIIQLLYMCLQTSQTCLITNKIQHCKTTATVLFQCRNCADL